MQEQKREGFMPELSTEKGLSKQAKIGIAVAVCVIAVVVFAALSGGGSTKVKNSLNDYSWAELSAISSELSEAANESEARDIASGYNLLNSSGKLDGTQTKKLTVDGKSTTAILVGIYADSKSDGSKAGLTFMLGDAVCGYEMYSSAGNEGGWSDSEMRSWLASDFTSMLPSDLKGLLVSVNKKTNSSASNDPGSISSTSDKIWLPSVVELGGSLNGMGMSSESSYTASTFNMEGAQYEAFKNMKVSSNSENSALVRKYLGSESAGVLTGGEPCRWWTRSLSMNWTAGFTCVSEIGETNEGWFSDYELGVVPGFCL